MNAYFDAMRRYFTISGRSTRSQFWLFYLFLFILMNVSILADVVLGTGTPEMSPITGVIYLAHLFPAISVTIRRLHDIDRSGWWFVFGLIPIVGTITMLVFACTASTPGVNRFGPPVGAGGTQTPPAGAYGTGSVGQAGALDQLEKLAALRASGAIDETEFQTMKSALLNSTTQPVGGRA